MGSVAKGGHGTVLFSNTAEGACAGIDLGLHRWQLDDSGPGQGDSRGCRWTCLRGWRPPWGWLRPGRTRPREPYGPGACRRWSWWTRLRGWGPTWGWLRPGRTRVGEPSGTGSCSRRSGRPGLRGRGDARCRVGPAWCGPLSTRSICSCWWSALEVEIPWLEISKYGSPEIRTQDQSVKSRVLYR
jgi:hypothetical protein